jgi:hypothetical protein
VGVSRWFYTRNNLFEAGPVVRVLIIGSMVAGFVVGVVAIDVAAVYGEERLRSCVLPVWVRVWFRS